MQKKQNGYTVIELLIVTFIIGLLVAIIAYALQGNIEKARDTRRMADLTQIQKALALYYNVNNYYPPIESAYSGPEDGNCGVNWCLLNNYLEPYLNPLPLDPNGYQTEYRYFYSSSASAANQTYGLMVRFESANNSSKVTGDGGIYNNASTLEYYEVGTQDVY
jgi:general secretion pathway protein G